MSDLEMIIGLATVMVLASYLLFKHRQRRHLRYGRVDPSVWTGKAIDVTPLKPTLEDLRRDYRTALSPAKGVCFHRALLRSVRRVMAQFAYFQHHEEDPPQTHNR